MSKELFRKVALERLSSPEQLDQLMRITKPTGWLSLLAIGFLIVLAFLWGFYGSIPIKVSGQGLLIKETGLVNILSPVSGQIVGISAHVGSFVEKGQIVARVAQPDILDKIYKSKMELQELLKQKDQITKFGNDETIKRTEYLDKERLNLTKSIDFLQQNIKWLKEQLKNQKQLLDQGLITKNTYLRTHQEINDNFNKINQTQNQLNQIAVEEVQLKSKNAQEITNIDQKINQIQLQMKMLQEDLRESSRIISFHTGYVLELRVNDGKLIGQGETILSMEVVDKEGIKMEVALFIRPTEGKKIHQGMKAQITPSTVKQEEHGCLIGLVTSVSEFPSSSEGMKRILQNDMLVQNLSKSGAPFEIRVELIPDPTLKSGYKWSSSKGPPIKIQAGTFCSGQIIIEDQKPISMVIPYLKKKILGIGQENPYEDQKGAGK
ncbi:MAG: NHLP bacteriocin system secretion protein [Desulfobacterales bacterium]|nr:NHLP bacteriocin system secretion protein [Desulfobacterales bacterium]MBF0396921.1 NHLP bacteriocin system secretion protein [Desulfobacterales bacterium]